MVSSSNHEDDGQETEAGEILDSQPSWTFFGLSYAAYLTIPRLALQELPVEWQQKFFDLLREAAEEHGLDTPSYVVMRRDHRGRLTSQDPWADYRHSTVAEARSLDIINKKSRF